MSKRFAIIVGIVLLGITALAVLVPIPHSDPVSTVGKTVETKRTPVPMQAIAAHTPAPDHYGEVSAALFSKPLSPVASAPKETPHSQPLADPPVVVPPPDIFADCVYSGTVTVDGQTHALVENSRTREGSYLVKGDKFMGATVMQVDESAVMLNLHGKMRRLPKSTTYNVVPLNASASSSTERNTQNSVNPNGAPRVSPAWDAEQQWAAEALARASAEGNLKTTVVPAADGNTSFRYSIATPNNP